MKIEDAIFYIKNTPVIASNADKETVQKAYDMAIEALEKHIPKEPIWEGSGYVYGEMVYDTWRCPSCDTLYEEDEKYHYCPSCGQRLDVGEEEY